MDFVIPLQSLFSSPGPLSSRVSGLPNPIDGGHIFLEVVGDVVVAPEVRHLPKAMLGYAGHFPANQVVKPEKKFAFLQTYVTCFAKSVMKHST